MYTISRWIYVVLSIQILCISRQTVHIMYTISRWIFLISNIPRICRVHIFCKSKHSVHIMYTIFRWIYAIQDITIFFKSRQSVYLMILMYIISHWIYAGLCVQRVRRVQFFCESRQSVHIMFTISCSIYAILDVQFSSNPDNPYIKCTQFPVQFTQFNALNVSTEFSSSLNPNISCL